MIQAHIADKSELNYANITGPTGPAVYVRPSIPAAPEVLTSTQLPRRPPIHPPLFIPLDVRRHQRAARATPLRRPVHRIARPHGSDLQTDG